MNKTGHSKVVSVLLFSVDSSEEEIFANNIGADDEFSGFLRYSQRFCEFCLLSFGNIRLSKVATVKNPIDALACKD